MKKRPQGKSTTQPSRQPFPIREGSPLHRLLELVAEALVRERIGGEGGKLSGALKARR